jgi:uncharacterized repeat protein (TIGR01451 family)
MFKHTSRIETVLRIGLMLVLLLNACGPAGKNKLPEKVPPVAPTATQPRNLPTNTPEYYQPPNYVPPTQNAVTTAKPILNLPPEKPAAPIAFSITASPAMVAVGDSITLEVRIKNNTAKPIANPAYSDILEAGLEFVPNSSNSVSFDVPNKQVSYTVASLEPGNEVSFSYKVQATEYNRSDQNGELWVHSVSLKDQGTLDLSAQASFVVGAGTQDQGSLVAAVPQDGGWASLGQLSVYMQPGSLKQNSILVASPVKKTSSSPAMQFTLKTIGIGNLAEDSKGVVAEQKTAVGQESSGKFAVPAFLDVNMDSVANLTDVPAGQEPFVATYDEKNQVWVKVPILKTDYGTNTLTVEAAHFSTWGAGMGASMPQNGTGALLFDQPYTSLFTGAARYSIPIWTPSGRAGMTPSISLSYSSGAVDGILGDVQAPWVGEGWNIDGTEIVRKITTNDNGYGYENSYSLTINGSLYELIRDTYDPTRYYVKDSGFLYVKLHNYALGNQQDRSGADPSNTSGEWWEVVTTDGTRYRLGWNQDSEQLALMYGYACSTGKPCTTPDGAYASSGYAGKADNLVARRWRVDQVTDTNGNYMTYSYTEVHPSATVPPFDRASYLTTISYTGFDGDGDTSALEPGYQVRFVLSDRSQNEDIPNQFNVWDIYDSKKLDRIEIYCLTCSTDPANAPIRTVNLNYTLDPAPNANGTLTLTSLTTSGGGFTESGALIPATSAADVLFTYTDMVNRASGNGDQFSYPRLAQIDNGYGAELTYTHENDGRSNTSWYNYRVKNVQVDSGLGTAVKRKYTYQSPAYEDLWNSPNLGALVGYATVTEASLDSNNGDADILDTIHQFGTEDPDKGRELWSEASSGGTVWKKTVNTYITDNSAATSPAWNYRYLARVESFVHGSGDPADTPSLTNMTTYYNDPATGNLLLQSDYLGANLYRKTYYEYAVNTDPAFYILNKVSRKLLVDASNQVYSDTYYYYDNGAYSAAPTKGLLTQTQTRTGNSPNEVVNATTDYDAYGNPQGNKVYSEFGTLKGGLPNTSIQSSLTYDSILHTYPVAQTNAMGESTNTTYFYTLGVPYQVSDANNWVTTTSYDGLGRTLAVIPPGFDPGQAGMAYIYPQPTSGNVAAPYYIEMQIFDPRCGDQGCYRSVWGFYDGLGRIIQNQVYDADNGNLLVTDINFNAQGLAWRQSLQYSVTTPGGNYITPDWNNLHYSDQEYDMLGRQTSSVTPGGSQTLTAYDGLTTTVTDPNGNQKSQTTDGLGRLVQVGEYTGTTLYATTQYSYDIADRQVETTDGQANVTAITYNMLGQKTGMHDPDMGVWTYSYDARGNMIQQTDGKSQTLTFSYDNLGRLQQKNNGNLTSYYYDGLTSDSQSTPIPGEIGMRTSISDQSGSSTWSYSDYGRKVTQVQTIGGVTNSFETVSDWLGRPFTVTNPDGETITYTYDALGRPLNFSSGDYQGITLASLAYNDVGQIASIALGKPDSGNAVVTVDNQYDLDQRLTVHKAGNNEDQNSDDAHNNFMNFTYSYDASGNITQLVDNTLNETSLYQYDSLNRLASADVYAGTPTPTTYQYLYRQNYEYDKIGNLLQVGNYGTGLAALSEQAAVTGADGLPSTGTNKTDSVASLPPVSRSLVSIGLNNLNYDSLTSTPTPTSTPDSGLWDANAAAFNNGGTYAWIAYGKNVVTNDSGSLKIAYVDNPNGAHEYLRDSADLYSCQ